MPDNKRTRSNCNSQQLTNTMPHCSLLIFDVKDKSKKRENPFDGSCDISNMLQNVDNNNIAQFSHSPTTPNTCTAREIKKRKFPSCTNTPPLSTPSPLTTNIQSNHSIIVNSCTTQSKTNTSSTLTVSPRLSVSRNTHSPTRVDSFNSFQNSPTSSSVESTVVDSKKFASRGLSTSFLEDMSSSILYIVTGRKDEKIEESMIWNNKSCISNREPESSPTSHGNNHCESSNGNGPSSSYSLSSSHLQLPNSFDRYQQQHSSFCHNNNHSSYCTHYEPFRVKENAIPKLDATLPHDHNMDPSTQKLPSIASLLERQ